MPSIASQMPVASPGGLAYQAQYLLPFLGGPGARDRRMDKMLQEFYLKNPGMTPEQLAAQMGQTQVAAGRMGNQATAEFRNRTGQYPQEANYRQGERALGQKDREQTFQEGPMFGLRQDENRRGWAQTGLAGEELQFNKDRLASTEKLAELQNLVQLYPNLFTDPQAQEFIKQKLGFPGQGSAGGVNPYGHLLEQWLQGHGGGLDPNRPSFLNPSPSQEEWDKLGAEVNTPGYQPPTAPAPTAFGPGMVIGAPRPSGPPSEDMPAALQMLLEFMKFAQGVGGNVLPK